MRSSLRPWKELGVTRAQYLRGMHLISRVSHYAARRRSRIRRPPVAAALEALAAVMLGGR